jgi:hypothetical protein
MKKRFCILLLVLAFFAAWAHFPTEWTESKLNDFSDLVVIGIPLATHDMSAKSSLGLSSIQQFQSVETEFFVVKTLKGQINSDHLKLQHYRDVTDTNGVGRDILLKILGGVEKDDYSAYELARPGGPLFIRFLSTTNIEYILYLKNVKSNYFAPAAGYLFSFESFRRFPSDRKSVHTADK